jgi:hypothetical protein
MKMRPLKNKVLGEEIRRSQSLSQRQPFLSRNLQALGDIDNGRDSTSTVSQDSQANDTPDVSGSSGWTYRSEDMGKLIEHQKQAVFLRIKGVSCASSEMHHHLRHEIFCRLELRLYGKQMHEKCQVYSAVEEARIGAQQIGNGSNFIQITSDVFDVKTAKLSTVITPLSTGRGWVQTVPKVLALELQLQFKSMGDAESLLSALEVDMPQEMAGSWITRLVTPSVPLRPRDLEASSIADLAATFPTTLPLYAVSIAKGGPHKLNCKLEIELSVPRRCQSLLKQHNSLLKPLPSLSDAALPSRHSQTRNLPRVTYIYISRDRESRTTGKKVERKASSCIFCKSRTLSNARSLYQHLLTFHSSFYFWLEETENDIGVDYFIFMAKKEMDPSTEQGWQESWHNAISRLNIAKYLDQANSEIEGRPAWAMRSISVLLSNYRTRIQSKALWPHRALLIQKGVSEDGLVTAFAQSWKRWKFLDYLILFLKLGATWNEVISTTRKVYFKRRKSNQEYRRAFTYKDVKTAMERYIASEKPTQAPIVLEPSPEAPEPVGLQVPDETAATAQPLQLASDSILIESSALLPQRDQSHLSADTEALASPIQPTDILEKTPSRRGDSPALINPAAISDDEMVDVAEAPSHSSGTPSDHRLSAPMPQPVKRQGPTPWTVEDLPRPERRKYVVPKLDSSQMVLYRSASKRQLQAGELVSESDDDVPMEWMKPVPITPGRRKSLRIHADQMSFMQKWNEHMLRWQPRGLRQYEKAICSFVREHKAWLAENRLVSEFMTKLKEIYEDDDIPKDVFESCKLYMDAEYAANVPSAKGPSANVLSTIINEASQRKRPRQDEEARHETVLSEAVGANGENLSKRSDATAGSVHAAAETLDTASTSKRRTLLKHVCVCGQRVTSIHKAIFCANPVSSHASFSVQRLI